jgi:hypothetical protein
MSVQNVNDLKANLFTAEFVDRIIGPDESEQRVKELSLNRSMQIAQKIARKQDLRRTI